MGGVLNCNSKAERKKGPWTREEDQKMLAYIQQHGHGSWRHLPTKAGLKRCGKSCRLRWTNYLSPDIKRGKLSTHEEQAIIRLHALLGNRWSCIAALLPKRTDNEIKNYWNTRLKKRLTRMGIDPTTHKPRSNPAGSAQSRRAAALSHMAQWEAARLQAEARLQVYKLPKLAFPPPPPPPCLFNSPTTSTLDFSGHSVTVPAVSTVTPMNSYRPYDDEILYPDYCDLTAPVDLASLNQDYEGDALAFVGEFEDSKNYWNYLLSMVSSPMMEPLLL